jgi:radical SAM-linked protein
VRPPDRHFALVVFRKRGYLRFLSHLDLARALDRAVRRAGLPVKYSQGFNPSAQIGFASALPVGVAGERELCQIELERPLTAAEVMRALAPQLPEDLGLVEVSVVSGPRRKHLSGLTRADYLVEFECTEGLDSAILSAAVAELLAERSLVIMRATGTRTREVDIRPGIHVLEVVAPRDPTTGPGLRMSLALEQERLVKPGEVVAALLDRLPHLPNRRVDAIVRRVTRLAMH